MAIVEFVVALTDKVSAPAKQASSGMSQAASQAAVLKKAMASLETQAVKAQALGDTAKLKSLTSQWDKLSNSLGQLQPALAQEAQGMAQGAEGAGLLEAGIDALGGPAAIAQKAISMLTTAVLALGAAFVAAIVGGATLAIKATEFKAQMTASFAALTGSAKAGQDVIKTIRSLEGMVPETEAQLVEAAKGLLAQGLDPSKLKATLLSMSAVAAAVGEDGANKIKAIMEKSLTEGHFALSPKQLLGTGLTEAALAKQLGLTPKAFATALKKGTITTQQGIDAMNALIKQKMGGVLEERMLDVGTQLSKFKDNLMKLFEDVNVKPFLEGLRSVLSLFDQSTASGKAMKFLVTQAFNAIFSVAAKAFPYIKAAIQQVIIAGLRLYIALKPAGKALSELFSSGKGGDGLASTIKLVSVAFGPVIAAAKVAAEFVVRFVQIVQGISGAIDSVKAKIASGMAAIKAIMGGGGSEAGGSLIDGLVAGVQSKTGMIMDAIRNLGGGIIDTLKSAIGAHSPSVEFMKIGGFATTGFAQGISAGRPQVAKATMAMAGTAKGGAAAGAAPAGKGGGGDLHVTVEKGAVIINGAGGDVMDLTEEAIALLFERIALSRGRG